MAEGGLKHRLAAILAADVAGYSRLMSLDERATVAALDAARAVFRKQIEANQGRVIDMAGDSVLAVFDTAAGAVRAALGVQAALLISAAAMPEDRCMRFRIGIHLGDVIEKTDGTVYGDGVNMAARLQGLAEPGGISVSESIRSAVKGRVTATFEDQGEQQVKNIADPVRAYRARAAGTKTPSSKRSVADIDLSLPDKPSIAVLPFTNMSGDPDQEYFTDGVTEDIITELSRFPSLLVIARNSSFTYKSNAVDIKQVARDLGVRYVLEGSIRKAGNRIRVTAQLIDSTTGSHIWAEKYDRVIEDIFAVQEEVTECIVGAIAPQINAAETLRARRRPGSLSAYELAVRARAMALAGHEKSDVHARNEAIRLAREALAVDPESLEALEMLAYAQWQHVIYRTVEDRQAAWRDGMNAAMLGISLAQSGISHMFKAFLLAYAPAGGRWNEARIEIQVAWQRNPQDVGVLSAAGWILANAGDPWESIRLLERALRLNPRDPRAFNSYASLAQAYFAARDYGKGLAWAQRCITMAPEFSHGHFVAAVLHVGLGDIDKAKAAFDRARELNPEGARFRTKGEKTVARDLSETGAESRLRFYTFLRIAAGLENPNTVEALR